MQIELKKKQEIVSKMDTALPEVSWDAQANATANLKKNHLHDGMFTGELIIIN